jgi:hypothetical protein
MSSHPPGANSNVGHKTLCRLPPRSRRDPALSARQQPAADSSGASVPASPAEIHEVHIDQFCRVLTPGHASPAHPNPIARYRYDNTVCHLESRNASSHWEQTAQNGVPKRIYVTAREHEYVLQNITGEPVTFVVEQSLPKGWSIDSEPQPDAMLGSAAIFRVVAQPDQIVRLHVGERS